MRGNEVDDHFIVVGPGRDEPLGPEPGTVTSTSSTPTHEHNKFTTVPGLRSLLLTAMSEESTSF